VTLPTGHQSQIDHGQEVSERDLLILLTKLSMDHLTCYNKLWNSSRHRILKLCRNEGVLKEGLFMDN
jgi:hypothetical protein